MYVNLELVELHFIRILIIYTYIVRVAKQNLFFLKIISICAKSEFNTCMNDATFLLMRKNQNQYCEHRV